MKHCATCGRKYLPPSHRFGGKAANTCLRCHRVALLHRLHAVNVDLQAVFTATVGTPLYRAAMNRIYCRRRRCILALHRTFKGN